MVEHTARKVDAHDLHPQAQAEIGHLLFTGIARRQDLALNTARPETARDQDPIGVLDHFPALVLLQVGRMDPADLHLDIVVQRGMLERLAHRHIGILQLDIFSNQRHFDRWLRLADALHELFPGFHIRPGRGVHAKLLDQVIANARPFQEERDFV